MMLRSGLCLCAVLALVVCASCALPAVAQAGVLDVLDSHFRSDRELPQYAEYWTEASRREHALRGDVLFQTDRPLGGSLHVFVRNTSGQPVTLGGLSLQGISLKRAVAFNRDREIRRGGLYPASVHYADLSAAEHEKLQKAGTPVWWRVDPLVVPPGGCAEATIRLRRAPDGPVTVSLEREIGPAVSARIAAQSPGPRFSGIAFSPSLDTAYLYVKHPGGPMTPLRVLMDGIDLTGRCELTADPQTDVVPVVLRLPAPLEPGSYHCFQAGYGRTGSAVAGLRCWGAQMAWGIWGARQGTDEQLDLAREYLREIALHNISVQMEMVGSAAVGSLLASEEGHALMESLGIRRMVSTPGKGGTKQPWAYFLTDEPDSADFEVQGIPAEERVGLLTQGIQDMAERYRKQDPFTPSCVNIDSTFKPENWYTYGLLADIFATDPYYQARLKQCYWDFPGQLARHTRATIIEAVSATAKAACEPRPLHIILFSVQTTQKDRIFRFATPEEKRIEVFYALGEGASSISFWWYTPAAPSYGCGAPEPTARALWREIGLLGAEIGTAGPLIARGCPADVPVEHPRELRVRSILCGRDAMVLLCVNDDYACDRDGITIRPIEPADVTVRVPAWLKPADVFEMSAEGVSDVRHDSSPAGLNLSLGSVKVTRMVVVTADPSLRQTLQRDYQQRYAANVAALLASGAAPAESQAHR